MKKEKTQLLLDRIITFKDLWEAMQDNPEKADKLRKGYITREKSLNKFRSKLVGEDLRGFERMAKPLKIAKMYLHRQSRKSKSAEIYPSGSSFQDSKRPSNFQQPQQ